MNLIIFARILISKLEVWKQPGMLLCRNYHSREIILQRCGVKKEYRKDVRHTEMGFIKMLKAIPLFVVNPFHRGMISPST